DGKFKFRQSMADEIKTLKSEDYLNLKASDSAEKCIKLLTERYELENYKNKTELRNLISVHYNMELNAYSNTTPYIFAKNISTDMVAIVSENMQGISGVEIQTFLTRTSPNGSLAPHLIGALGSISQEEYEEKTKEGKDYGFNDSIGKFGVESAFEDELRGVGGERLVQKDSDGNVTKVASSVEAQPGHTIYLTLDSKLQKVANDALQKQITAARKFGETEALSKGKGNGEDCETGAVVMLNVKDFSVLAAASYPSYNLNKYTNYDDYYISLADDKNSPLYDRAFNGSFAPGSVFKPCVACAALQEGIINSGTTFECTKNYTFYPTNPVACMGYHGDISLNSAIAQSCNYYFAETGRQIGIDTM
ncbi:MAG: penicillin-binding protein, partial [Ruminococcus sp.]|nr:penicillin-binding protein [Ruminococcus sp.]